MEKIFRDAGFRGCERDPGGGLGAADVRSFTYRLRYPVFALVL